MASGLLFPIFVGVAADSPEHAYWQASPAFMSDLPAQRSMLGSIVVSLLTADEGTVCMLHAGAYRNAEACFADVDGTGGRGEAEHQRHHRWADQPLDSKCVRQTSCELP